MSTDYTTLALLKSRMGGLNGSSSYDTELSAAITAASRMIDDYCQRRFDSSVDTRIFEPQDPYLCPTDDIVSITTLKVDFSGQGVYSVAWTAGQYQLLPVNPLSTVEDYPYTAIRALAGKWFPPQLPFGQAETVQIVGTFGWSAVPAAVAQACLVLAQDLFKAREAAFGVTSYGDFGPMRLRANPLAEILLKPYRRDPASDAVSVAV